jgi:hypothetical protein
MNINHLLLIGIFALIFVFLANRFYLREGQTTISNDECDPVANVKKSPNDTEIGSLISDHVANATSTLDFYLPQLQEIQNKFRNISSCLSIGTVDVSSENSVPVVIIDDPVPGTIDQKINYILPKGQPGEKGSIGQYPGALGLWGNKGPSGTRGPVGQNIIPKNIYTKVY